MQKDLFGTAPAMAIADSLSPKMSFLDRYRMAVRLDQALFLLIGLLVIYVLVFSFGVETGKRYAMSELRAERMKRERMVEELRDKVFANAQQASNTGTHAAAPLPAIADVQTALKSKLEAAAINPSAGSDETRTASSAQTAAVSDSGVLEGKYTIQILTIASKSVAEKEMKRLTEKGMKSFIIPKGKMQQICVNAFESREKASQSLKELKSQGTVPADAYVRPMAA